LSVSEISHCCLDGQDFAALRSQLTAAWSCGVECGEWEWSAPSPDTRMRERPHFRSQFSTGSGLQCIKLREFFEKSAPIPPLRTDGTAISNDLSRFLGDADQREAAQLTPDNRHTGNTRTREVGLSHPSAERRCGAGAGHPPRLYSASRRITGRACLSHLAKGAYHRRSSPAPRPRRVRLSRTNPS
jgi:hypothetical protein